MKFIAKIENKKIYRENEKYSKIQGKCKNKKIYSENVKLRRCIAKMVLYENFREKSEFDQIYE